MWGTVPAYGFVRTPSRGGTTDRPLELDQLRVATGMIIPWGTSDEPSRGGDQPVSPPARPQPGELVPVGRGGVRARPRGGQAGAAVERVRGGPLVPRHGAGVV